MKIEFGPVKLFAGQHPKEQGVPLQVCVAFVTQGFQLSVAVRTCWAHRFRFRVNQPGVQRHWYYQVGPLMLMKNICYPPKEPTI